MQLPWVSKARVLARGAGSAGLMVTMMLRAERRSWALGESEKVLDYVEYVRKWCRGALKICGVTLDVSPEVPAPRRGARLVVANHRSPFDIPILLGLFGGHALSRADIADWPVMGIAARRSETIFVDRKDRLSGARAIRNIRSRLQAGRSVLVFPEGTTFKGDEVRTFQAGAFVAARSLDVEVVPVGIAYDEGTEWGGGSFPGYFKEFAARPSTNIAVRVGVPRKLSGTSGDIAKGLRDEVQELVREARDRHRTRFGP